MTIDEAIKILGSYIGTGTEAEPVDFDNAVGLGIEALKVIKDAKLVSHFQLLPGETKD